MAPLRDFRGYVRRSVGLATVRLNEQLAGVAELERIAKPLK
jgi:hypothetical protein